jgi:hypothetical protein
MTTGYSFVKTKILKKLRKKLSMKTSSGSNDSSKISAITIRGF